MVEYRDVFEGDLRGDLVGEFVEVESGKKRRPALARALEACRKQEAKLVIANVDSLTRSHSLIDAS
ncbi:MAG: recombinase family protein [Xanthobacteraceae bacterium]